MDILGHPLIAVLVVVEIIQLALFFAFIRYRYGQSLRQLSRMTEQLAAGNRPMSYYIDGPRQLGGIIGTLNRQADVLLLEAIENIRG